MLLFLAMVEDPEDRAKIEQIYDLYSIKMHQVAYGILHNKFDAEDAVQIAMFNACKHIGKLGEPGDKTTKWYVMEATKNAAKNIYKKKKGRWKKEMPFEEAFAGDDALPRYHQGSTLSKYVAKLPARDRDVLILKYVYGYEYAEIATILGMSYEAAKKAGQRAKERLKKSMEEGEENND